MALAISAAIIRATAITATTTVVVIIIPIKSITEHCNPIRGARRSLVGPFAGRWVCDVFKRWQRGGGGVRGWDGGGGEGGEGPSGMRQ